MRRRHRRDPGELKFIFCSGADLERADSALLHEAAELGDGDLCGNQPVSVTSFWRGGLRVYSEGAMKRLSALRFAHSSLSSPPRLSISTSEFAAPLCRCRRKNATVSGKTRPFLGKRSHLDTFRRRGGIACSIRRSAPTGSIGVKAPSILSTADLPSATSAAAAAAASISAAAEAAAAAASFASAFSRRSAHAVVRVKGLRLDDIGKRVISYCSLCGDGALSHADCAAAVTGGFS